MNAMTPQSQFQQNRMSHIISFTSVIGFLLTETAVAQYHNFAQIEADLATAAANHPSICRRYNIGSTVQGRAQWAMLITDQPDAEEDEPEVRYVSSLHGDEIIGIEMCFRLIDHLTDNYGIDPQVTSIVNETEVWILPCANPDGFVAVTRGNAHGVDLNRSFPCPYTSPQNTTVGREPETANIMNWCQSNSFTLAANFHSGTRVVNYPYDANATGSSVYTVAPDDDLFIWISEQYSKYNLPMWNSASFFHGITNGADWYVIYGGLQDWTYVYTGGNEVTIELADSTPPAAQIATYWQNNRQSMLSYIETARVGVRGIVTDVDSGEPLAAIITVDGRDHAIQTDPDVGDYHRMLLSGVYDLAFDADGHDPRAFPSVSVAEGPATRLDVGMFTSPVLLTPRDGDVFWVGVPAFVSWTSRPDVSYGVEYSLNAGQTQTLTDDFEDGVFGSEYQSDGTAPWTIQASSPHAGLRAARAGVISHNQQSWLSRTVEGPATISFWYRVSSEQNYDFLEFSVDGLNLLRVSGNVAYAAFTCDLTDGNHNLKWNYSKDVSLSVGSDTAWIDDLQIVADATHWTVISDQTPPGQGSLLWMPPSESDTARVRIRAQYSDGVIGRWVANGSTFSIVARPGIGDLNCDGEWNMGDVDAMTMALTAPENYALVYPGCDITRADMNGDLFEDGSDITLFVAHLVGP